MKYPFENLALSGGGVWGIAYLGMLEELEKAGALGQIQRVVGASAGAISSMLISFQLSAAKTKELADTLDYRKVPQKTTEPRSVQLDAAYHAFQTHAPGITPEDFICLLRLINKKGWYSSEYFYGWLQGVVASQFKDGRTGKKYTFADFANPALHKNEQAFRQLHVIGCDANTHQAKVFSTELTPEVEVAEAVRISMSIPFFFEAQNFIYPPEEKADVFVDGGTIWNYPINFFDDKHPPEATFGARFDSQESKPSRNKDNNLLQHIKDITQSAWQAQNLNYQHSPLDQKRSISIDTGCIDATEFNISPNDDDYQRLYLAGRAATCAFLSRCER
ncbi:patatin-like phospholipase family protein [Chromobacterium haemolyticum]|uniref:patatin-like phospholipase family protein n=1 Tax=Chromobacterium haemolyticum TaxID=394935 RepID=UPI000DEEA7E8|nr:patatin-like phospholipase family protein [Chromobacterium haemolyticum]